MESAAPHFPYYASAAAIIIFLVAWAAAQALHYRRLRRFGNPQLLGLAGLWPRRICSAVLMAGAAGALVPLLGGAGAGSHPSDESPRLMVFLVDPPPRLPGPPYADTAWGDYVRDLQLVVESIKPDRFAVYLSGSPPVMVVPPTRDVPGAFLLLEAGLPEYEASTANAVVTSVEAIRLISSRSGAEAVSGVVVVSPRTEQEIDVAAGAIRGVPRLIFVRSTQGKEALAYRSDVPGAQWTRLDMPGPLKALATGLQRENQQQDLPRAQLLALTAFLLLFLECAIRLSWAAGGGSGSRILPYAGAPGKPAEETRAPGPSMCVMVALVCLAARHAGATVPSNQAGEAHSTSLDALSPHVAVVTEISNAQPFVGQQLSVIYKLRCSIPPLAVDVDPQDFTGFWTVTAPTTGQARAEAVTLNGRPATDFLLRQLIVFPLRPGKQALPPLRLKIKQDSSSREDWDLTASTRSVEVNVRAVPSAVVDRGTFFMVGSLEGRLSGGGPDSAREAVLEVEGTANLEFFRPQRWLKFRDGHPVLIRLRDTESLIQTRDYEGKRRLTLLQRQRWVVSAFAEGSASVRMESSSVPFFDPQASKWRALEIPSFVLGTGSGAPQSAPTPHPDPGLPGQSQSRFRGAGSPVAVAFIVSCLALLVVILTGSRERVGRGTSLITGQGRRAGASS